NSKSTEANATVSVQNNLPNADAGNTGAGSQEARQEETTNYEISRTVRTLIREQPQIDRISLAVMVDEVETTAPDGTRTWQPRSEEDLARITGLVKSAIGFDEKRGDHVEVVSMRFAAPETPAVEQPGLFGMTLEKADLLHLAQTGLFGVIGLLGLLLVLRPMVNRLVTLAPATTSTDAANATALAPAGAAGTLAATQGSSAAVAQASQGAVLLEDDSMVDVNRVEGQIRASSLRKITDLVERHPDEALTIVRGWMIQKNG
ncbi:MAG: flagellar M-ring protein FliF, partial [Acetobacteraceae bacterium]|nr:flagellar M-ring protein FliF [Acetobacteraceae bacterium]